MKSRAHLEQENHQIRQVLLAQESRHEATLEAKDAFIEQLKQALILARNTRFAASSESLRSLQLELFNEAEQEDDAPQADASDDLVTVPRHQRRRGGRKPLPEDLPRIEVIHDLSDEDKVARMMAMR